jgi:TPP-dependent trihydroxycyclohexane-1,2-dione (THcHDO) dehydratase
MRMLARSKIILAINRQKCDGCPVNANRIKTTFGSLLAAALTASGAVLAADSPALTLARQLNEAFIEVADKVSPSVVVITVTEKPSTNSDDGASWWDLLPPEERSTAAIGMGNRRKPSAKVRAW